MTRKVAIIQARMSSSRLPGKILMPLLGTPAIVFMVKRVQKSKLIDEVIVATSNHSSDHALAEELQRNAINCFRGDLHDVLDRFYRAAVFSGAEHIVRLTGDCPLMDPDLIDHALMLLSDADTDYVSNVDPPSYPDGLDVEAFDFRALQRAWREAQSQLEREHVTPFIRDNKDIFRTKNWTGLADMSALRWTVDHQDDMDEIRKMLEKLGSSDPLSFDRFDLYRVCELMPSLRQARHIRNEGLVIANAIDVCGTAKSV